LTFGQQARIFGSVIAKNTVASSLAPKSASFNISSMFAEYPKIMGVSAKYKYFFG
jgi:hypothetical protein